MKKVLLILFAVVAFNACNQQPTVSLSDIFQTPPESAKPWVFWYWMKAAVTKEGISADLEAMHEMGIGGAYLMPIKGVQNPPLIDPPAVQLTPEWWKMVKHAFKEADRLGLKLAMHASDGFALAGGPWITPELSMQRVVWADTILAGGKKVQCQLPQPIMLENYYNDIATYAYPAPAGSEYSSRTRIPRITASTGEDVQYLANPNDTQKFRSKDPCWLQYEFQEPFLCRTITIRVAGNSYQAQRMLLEVSDNGTDFRQLGRLETPRHGWQDTDADYTYSINPVKATFFRFVYNPEGSEPGSEDLDAAKWSPSLKIAEIELSGKPTIGGIEGKNGTVWRIAKTDYAEKLPEVDCVKPSQLLNISKYVDANGKLNWDAPAGNWIVLRMGHTSTGHTNYTAGGGLGLEVDKFSRDAVKFQYDQWCGKIIQTVGPELASRVLRIFHVDSWECGSQNWSPVFAAEFKKRRGYDPTPMLPAMAGVPIKSIVESEKFLKDIRQTIAELTVDNFYNVFGAEIRKDGCVFSGECVAPTMTSDGLLHYKELDIPMGEFWLRSPTHDKPNDALDAISGAHIYGKSLIQAEGFTELRMAWDEHPAMLKTLGDRNFAQGFNRFVFHVFAQNPWLDRKPGMTLDPIGLYFQRDQTWWNPGKAWIEYITRCQALLQQGTPVVDIAVFTGEQIPRRAVLPDRLVSSLPGIIGKARLEAEQIRLANEGLPLREMPRTVIHSANMADPEKWSDPLRGYAYDSFNPDPLLRLASVEKGRVVLPGGASYSLLIFPGVTKMNPDGNQLSGAVAEKIFDLVSDGASVLFSEIPTPAPGDKKAQTFIRKMFQGETFTLTDKRNNSLDGYTLYNGKIYLGTVHFNDFEKLGIEADFHSYTHKDNRGNDVAWNHRKTKDADVFFVSNQRNKERELTLSFRIKGKVPQLFNPVTGEITRAKKWMVENDRTLVPVKLPANGSIFVVFEEKTDVTECNEGLNWVETDTLLTINQPWSLSFNPAFNGPSEAIQMNELKSWTTFDVPAIKYYSGTAIYSTNISIDAKADKRVWLDLGKVANIAEVTLNGKPCGVAWTAPYRVEITHALQTGSNQLEVAVTNSWANRLMGDRTLPEEQRLTWTTAPYMLEGKPLLEAGLFGEVVLLKED